MNERCSEAPASGNTWGCTGASPSKAGGTGVHTGDHLQQFVFNSVARKKKRLLLLLLFTTNPLGGRRRKNGDGCGELGWDTRLGEMNVPLLSSPLRAGNMAFGIWLNARTLTHMHRCTQPCRLCPCSSISLGHPHHVNAAKFSGTQLRDTMAVVPVPTVAVHQLHDPSMMEKGHPQI